MMDVKLYEKILPRGRMLSLSVGTELVQDGSNYEADERTVRELDDWICSRVDGGERLPRVVPAELLPEMCG